MNRNAARSSTRKRAEDLVFNFRTSCSFRRSCSAEVLFLLENADSRQEGIAERKDAEQPKERKHKA